MFCEFPCSDNFSIEFLLLRNAQITFEEKQEMNINSLKKQVHGYNNAYFLKDAVINRTLQHLCMEIGGSLKITLTVTEIKILDRQL